MFCSAFFIQLVLATAAFALPTLPERRQIRLGRHSPANQSVPAILNSTSNDVSSTNWGGAVLEGPSNTFTVVAGSFTLPHPQEPSGQSGLHGASIWVGIDGAANCKSGLIQTGIEMFVDGGSVNYVPWYEFWPDPAIEFSGIDFSPGDVVTLSITAHSRNSATAVILNGTKGKTVQKDFSASHTLCQSEAEWIVEAFTYGNSQLPLANFGTVQFRDAVAGLTNGGHIFPNALPTIWNVVQNGKQHTKTVVQSNTVTISYM